MLAYRDVFVEDDGVDHAVHFATEPHVEPLTVSMVQTMTMSECLLGLRQLLVRTPPPHGVVRCV